MNRTLGIRNVVGFVAALVLQACILTAGFAQPSVNIVLPTAIQRGVETEINFHGGQLSQPHSLLFYRPGIEVIELKEVDIFGLQHLAPHCQMLSGKEGDKYDRISDVSPDGRWITDYTDMASVENYIGVTDTKTNTGVYNGESGGAKVSRPFGGACRRTVPVVAVQEAATFAVTVPFVLARPVTVRPVAVPPATTVTVRLPAAVSPSVTVPRVELVAEVP